MQKPLNSCCFCVPGPERDEQNKETPYGFPETIKNVVQTIGFHNWPFLRTPVGATVLGRATLDSQRKHKKPLENQWFLEAHAGQCSLRLVGHLDTTRKSYGFSKTFENVAQTIGSHNWRFGNSRTIKGSAGSPSGQNVRDVLLQTWDLSENIGNPNVFACLHAIGPRY